ncbi:MAG: hypothetical protein ACE5EQ_02625 [Phycisphaerae bacterium]
MNKRIPLTVLLALFWSMAGCAHDPYSARRIERRRSNFQQTLEALEKREASSPARMERNRRWMERWWKADVRGFRARLPTVGDYIW